MNEQTELLKDIIEGLVKVVRNQVSSLRSLGVIAEKHDELKKSLEESIDKQTNSIKSIVSEQKPVVQDSIKTIKTEVEVKEPEWVKRFMIDESVIAPLTKAISALRNKIADSPFGSSFSSPKEPIAVRLSDGKDFYKASGSGGGGTGVPYPAILEEPPTSTRKNNPSYVYAYDSNNKLTTITMTINGVSYVKTLTWTNSLLTATSKWVQS